MIIFDTNTVTHYSYGNEKIRARIDQISADDVLAVTIITRMEVLQGRFASILNAAKEAEILTAMKRFREAEALLDSFRVVDLDSTAAQLFEKLRKQKKLQSVGRPDLLIACIALANKATLVTRNTKDFKDVTGLRVENWMD